MRYPGLPESALADERALRAEGQFAAPASPYAILRPAQPYDLATPGTPAGILAVARVAGAGGGWQHRATFALAVEHATGAVVASLALRLQSLVPPQRRAWVVYARTGTPDGSAGPWRPSGAGLLDVSDEVRPVRPVGIEELKATLRGETWTPPAPRPPGLTVPCPTCGRAARITNTGKIYSSHRCAAAHAEGRS